MLSPSFVCAEIGVRQMKFLEQDFIPYLTQLTRKEKVKYRIAPSIVTRSECELFAVSSPRFSIRAHLPNGSFINLRRLVSLRNSVEEWTEPWPVSQSGVTYRSLAHSPDKVIQELLDRPGNCVADSLIKPSEKVGSEYELLTNDASAAYGEARTQLTPFIRHMDLGGGMCAQACLFMATHLLHDYAVAVEGIPEISARASSVTKRGGVIAQGGLSGHSVALYLGLVGLAGRPITSPPVSIISDRSLPTSLNKLVSNQYVTIALRAYLASHLPVIVPLEGSTFWWGKAKVLQNNLGWLKPADVIEPEGHAVVAVGYHKKHRSKFLINDPGTFPFLQVGTSALSEAMARYNGGNHEQQTLIPVTPREVKLGLWGYEENDTSVFGLIDLVLYARRFGVPWLKSNIRWFEPGEFRLIRTTESDEKRRRIIASLDLKQDIVDLVQKLLLEVHWPEWCWLQHRKPEHAGVESLAIWDGTRSPSDVLPRDESDLRKWLCILIERTEAGNLTIRDFRHRKALGSEKVPRTAISPQGAQRKRSNRNLVPCLLTSFSTKHVRSSISALSESKARDAELYCMMQTDSSRLVKHLRRRLKLDIVAQTAMELLSKIWDDKKAIELVSRTFDYRLRTHGIHCRALATFFPTLSFPYADMRGQMAERALISVQKIAHELRTTFKHDVCVIEIVSGSRVYGVWPGWNSKNKERFWANIGDTTAAQTHLAKRLSSVGKYLESVGVEKTTIALELEPGNLFTVGSWSGVESMCRIIEAQGLGSWVGLNLDIAHWHMASIDVDKVRENPEIYSRIAHVHISGHHPTTHFGDLGLSVLNDNAEFTPWLDLIADRIGMRSEIPFSGLITLELEACAEGLHVNAFQELTELLA